MKALDQHIHFLWDEIVAARTMVSDSQNGARALSRADEIGITSVSNQMAEHRNAFLELRNRLENREEFTSEDLEFLATASEFLLSFQEEAHAIYQTIQALEVARRQDMDLMREHTVRLEEMNRPVGLVQRIFRRFT